MISAGPEDLQLFGIQLPAEIALVGEHGEQLQAAAALYFAC